ncbi:cytochrome b-c1 complex subunit 6, mitochondrial-like isoform X2 [Dreissena polymorpha]|uniref:Cytochrome b-c1 complex subunit 6 n=1 Tax=Dreissena polymorpha TaxID=45954 RepID=A0A9D4BJI6_DREPO|nr:cytochrome b-c1 complex subunit 6, mitochondrial-like isoform X2 [Dreissena polymorpha]KAH3695693.1 hypothetical protein DPMN_083151 [Dreissena polymorpha]
MVLENEVVALSDPKEEPEAEEEEEVDLVDPVDEVRAKCEMDSKAQQLNLILQACNDRVSKRSNTEESCHEELIDYVQHVDHCVGKKIFSKLK